MEHNAKSICEAYIDASLPPSDLSCSYFFEMSDRAGRFNLSLESVLACLAIASYEGLLPAVSDRWWFDVHDAVPVKKSVKKSEIVCADLIAIEPTIIEPCPDCGEECYFHFSTTQRTVQIGLSTILSALAFAQHRAVIPALPEAWWRIIRRNYH